MALVPIIVVLCVLARKNSIRDVFLTLSDNGAGWLLMGMKVMVGQVSAMFTVLCMYTLSTNMAMGNGYYTVTDCVKGSHAGVHMC